MQEVWLLTWMSCLFSQTFQRYLWSCVMLPLKGLRDELAWKRLVIIFLCMRSRLEAHILVMPEWCPKLLAFIICREVVSFICQLREDKCFMEVSVLAIISPCTLEDWSCWMLGWYCIIVFVHLVAGFEPGFYYFVSMCPCGLICKFDEILDFIPVMILKPDVCYLAYRIMLFYKLFCKVPSHFQYPQLLVLLLQAVFSLKFHSRTAMFLALHFHLVERSPTWEHKLGRLRIKFQVDLLL